MPAGLKVLQLMLAMVLIFGFLGIVFSPAVLGLDSDRSDSVWAGVNQCIVLAVMANRPREDSEVDPLEDEMDFCKSMRQAGFKKQFPFSDAAERPRGRVP